MPLGIIPVLNWRPAGTLSALNQTIAAVIKATPGLLARISIVNAGTTGGAFTLNDCTTVGAAAASNQIWTLAFNASTNVAGNTFVLEWPCLAGIVLSAVPTGGTPIIAIAFGS